MTVLAHGIDLIECDRIAAILDRHRDRFMARVLTPIERARADQFTDPVQHVAGRFAAKEAVLKTLGTGWRGQIAWTDIEITNDELGRPQVRLTGECERIARDKRMAHLHISITHTRAYAAASVVATDDETM